MASTYTLLDLTATSVPVTGRFIAHARLTRAERAFLASDLVDGVRRLIEPTQVQAALLVGVNRTSVFWAIKRQAERAAIEAGHLSLVPTAPAHVNGGNGAAPRTEIDDAELRLIATAVGADRMLAAACAADHR